MAMDNPHGVDGSWVGLSATIILGIIAKVTLSDFALVCTILAALSTFGLNVYKAIKHK